VFVLRWLVRERIVVERIVARRRLVGQLGGWVRQWFEWRVQRGIRRRFERWLQRRLIEQLGQRQLERWLDRRRQRRAGAVRGAAHLLHLADRERLQ
jgi:hypothetical protein